MDVFKRHDGYAEYYNDLYGDVLASCEDEELEEYELSENEVAKKDLNEEEEKEEELNKEETNDVINEKEELDVEAEDANKGKGALPKLAEGEWTLAVKQPGRALKAIKKKTVKKKKDKKKKKKEHKNKKCVRVQSHNGRVSEVSCENCTHTAIAAQKNLSKVCFIQRDISGIGLHHESCWDCNGIAIFILI